MNADPKKWNPFKFLRGSGRKPEAGSGQSTPDSEPPRGPWPDISRLLSRDPWRASEREPIGASWSASLSQL